MQARRRRPLAALAAGAVTAGSVLLFAQPAEACSCAPGRTLEEALADGAVLAILSRVDTDREAHTVRLRVERTLDGTLPAEVAGKVGYPEPCDYAVPFGGVTVRLVERVDDVWQVAYCQFPDADTFQRMAGDPAATSRGPAVLLAAGSFEGARLATVDSTGDVVAWDARPGVAEAAAVCPGADTVVAIGRGDLIREKSGGTVAPPTELSVHDAETLDVRRTTTVHLGDQVFGQALALRCRDARGGSVDVLEVTPSKTDDTQVLGKLLTVGGGTVESRPLGIVTGGVATADGFLVVAGEHPASVVRLGLDGSRRVLAQLPDGPRVWSELVLSPDGTTAAVRGHLPQTRLPSVVTVDVESRTVLADRADTSGEVLTAWSGPDRLLMWRPPSSTVDGRIRVVDRRLRTLETIPAPSGAGLTAVGGRPVSFGGSARMNVYPAAGPPRIVDELRLTGALSLVPLPALADHPFAPPAGLLPPHGETELSSTMWKGVPFVLTGAAAAVVGLALLRRRTKGASH